jgi:hypothetical protein
MNVKDNVRYLIGMCDEVTSGYVKDLKDSELFIRSVPGVNHIAWQLGHLITSTHGMLSGIGKAVPALPAGFAEAYTKETAASDNPAKFHKLADYLKLHEQLKAATLAALDATPDADFDKPAPEAMKNYAPTIAAVFTIIPSHWLMHAGQFVPVRRKLGKPALF